jgi:hypothetical protein
MPHNAAFSLARLYCPAVAVKGSLRRASPALDRAHRTLLNQIQPTWISKEAKSPGVLRAVGGDTMHQ